MNCPNVWAAGKHHGDNSHLRAFLFPKYSHIFALICNVTSHNSNMWTFFFNAPTGAGLSTQHYGTSHKAGCTRHASYAFLGRMCLISWRHVLFWYVWYGLRSSKSELQAETFKGHCNQKATAKHILSRHLPRLYCKAAEAAQRR